MPKGRTGSNWHLDIYDANELLEGKITKSKKLDLVRPKTESKKIQIRPIVGVLVSLE